MKTFIYKAILFVLIVLSVFFFIASGYNPPVDLRNDYFASLIDKHKQLKQAGNNRLIFVGGSNLNFGINSEEIEKELNVPVVDLGLHAGLGLDFILNEAMSEIKQGDIVVLSIEYELYDSKNEAQVLLIEQAQRVFPEAKTNYNYSLRDLKLLYLKHFSYFFEKHKKTADTLSIYNRKSFNTRGDINVPIETTKPESSFSVDKFTHIVSHGFNPKFLELYNKCKSVGAKLYFTFPNYPKSGYELNRKPIKEFESQLRKEFSFIPIINSPETFVYDDSFFYDATYHLNTAGKELRTKKLISILKTTLSQTK